MKQALIIGSTVVDVTVRLPRLPVTGEDVIVESQSMSLGGCAYVCGLELDEDTGSVIRDNLEEYPEYTVYFAPGPRISFIPQGSLERMFSLSPSCTSMGIRPWDIRESRAPWKISSR